MIVIIKTGRLCKKPQDRNSKKLPVRNPRLRWAQRIGEHARVGTQAQKTQCRDVAKRQRFSRLIFPTMAGGLMLQVPLVDQGQPDIDAGQACYLCDGFCRVARRYSVGSCSSKIAWSCSSLSASVTLPSASRAIGMAYERHERPAGGDSPLLPVRVQ